MDNGRRALRYHSCSSDALCGDLYGAETLELGLCVLAPATLLKLYPAILLVPFVLALQQETRGTWYAWRRWLPVGVFVGICVLVIGGSLLLSVAGTVAPLAFFIDRPVHVESLSASMLWIASMLWKTPLTIGSDVASPLSGYVTFLMNVLLAIGLCSTWRLQRRGRIDLAMACLLTLLIVLVTAKVFSPQYLLWVIPLVAYVGQTHRWWLLFWIPVAFLDQLASDWTLHQLDLSPYHFSVIDYSDVVGYYP